MVRKPYSASASAWSTIRSRASARADHGAAVARERGAGAEELVGDVQRDEDGQAQRVARRRASAASASAVDERRQFLHVARVERVRIGYRCPFTSTWTTRVRPWSGVRSRVHAGSQVEGVELLEHLADARADEVALLAQRRHLGRRVSASATPRP